MSGIMLEDRGAANAYAEESFGQRLELEPEERQYFDCEAKAFLAGVSHQFAKDKADMMTAYMVGHSKAKDETRARDEKVRTALRQTLGWFALSNDEEDRAKWPKYVSTCEEALRALDGKGAAGE